MSRACIQQKRQESWLKKYEVSMPIVEKVNQVLFEGKPAKDAVSELMMRDGRSEYSNLPWD